MVPPRRFGNVICLGLLGSTASLGKHSRLFLVVSWIHRFTEGHEESVIFLSSIYTRKNWQIQARTILAPFAVV